MFWVFPLYDIFRKQDEVVAMKIIKNIQKYRDAAKLEIKVLQKLKKKDPTNKK